MGGAAWLRFLSSTSWPVELLDFEVLMILTSTFILRSSAEVWLGCFCQVHLRSSTDLFVTKRYAKDLPPGPTGCSNAGNKESFVLVSF